MDTDRIMQQGCKGDIFPKESRFLKKLTRKRWLLSRKILIRRMMLLLDTLQKLALTPSGADYMALIARNVLIMDEEVPATPWNQNTPGFDI
jgi:hypothetical protein